MDKKLKIIENIQLSDKWYKLNKITFNIKNKNGELQTRIREVYDRGNGAAIFLYNPTKKNIILTRQFRLPAYLNESDEGMMIEVCAGMLDNQSPEKCIIKETEEETGYRITKVRKVFETYMSPGAVTEKLHFFIAEYNEGMKVSEGGGLEEEQEDIEVIEMSFDSAYEMMTSGAINDAKTIMLLQYAKINGLV